MAHGVVGESSALAEHEAESTRRSGLRSDVALTLLALLLIAIAGAVILFILAGRGDSTVTFNGEIATYSGPTSLDMGAAVFTFANDADRDMAFMVSEITDDSMSIADLDAYARDAQATKIPSWVGQYKTNIVAAGETVDRELMLEEGRWWVTVHSAPTDGNKVFPTGALLRVETK